MDNIILKVKECPSKDVGRGIARIDPSLYEKLDISVGSFIKIKGKSEAAVKVMPTFTQDRGKSIIQIDGITRENAGVTLDEKVSIDKLNAAPARHVFVLPSKNIRNHSNIEKYFGQLMKGHCIKSGNRIKANAFGFINEDFLIEKTIPDDFVEINQNTVFTIQEGNLKSLKQKITYEDVGGLGEQVRKIREMIELPLKYRDLFERLGIEAPKGVLLYGPPGTGKTLIAKAVANETSAHFISINGPEIIQKFYGESEANLRKIFNEAEKNSPSIIFIDEIDAIAPKRGKVVGDVEKRVVTQLLTLMDGVQTKGEIVVIGATNMPELIDTALRRPGRFDREIYIGVPDIKGRHEILNIHTRSIPLDEDVDLDKIAEVTHGFVGADISNLCREAAMGALRKILPDIDTDIQSIPYEKVMDLKVNMDNFLSALTQIEPSAMREVYIDMPQITWKDVGGYKDVKEELEFQIKLPLMYPKLFEAVGIKSGRGVLLCGQPGTGKTLLAKALAGEVKINFIYVKGPELMSKWIGESEKGIREVFKKARLASPCLIFFDEIDSIAPTRGNSGSDSGVSERVLSQLLIEMDGIEKRDGIMLLAATNRKDILDAALLRPGRFDMIVELKTPSLEEGVEIFNIYTSEMPIIKNIKPEIIIQSIKNPTGANISNVCKKAGMLAIQRYLAKYKDDIENNIKNLKVCNEDFISAVSMLGC